MGKQIFIGVIAALVASVVFALFVAPRIQKYQDRKAAAFNTGVRNLKAV